MVYISDNGLEEVYGMCGARGQGQTGSDSIYHAGACPSASVES